MFQTTSPSRSVGSAHEKNAMLSPDSKTKQMIPWAKPTLQSAAGISAPYPSPVEFTYQENFLYLKGNCLLISDSRSSTIKHKKVV